MGDIPGWVLVLTLFFTVLIGIVITLQVKIITTNETIVRAIPLGTTRVQERTPTRATGSTAQHRGEA